MPPAGLLARALTAELMKQEGPPTAVLDDPSGAKIWVYTTDKVTKADWHEK